MGGGTLWYHGREQRCFSLPPVRHPHLAQSAIFSSEVSATSKLLHWPAFVSGMLSSPAWDCFSECFSETLAAAADLSASDSCLLLKRMQFCAAAVFGRMYQSSEGTDASVSLDPLVEGNQVLN